MTAPLVIVAGAGPGVGAAIAHRFAAEGFRAALIARDRDRLAELAASIVKAGGSAAHYVADLSDHAATRAVLAAITADHGSPTVLIWNAAVWAASPALALDPAEFDRQLRLGLTSALAGVQTVAPSMVAGGGGSFLITGGGLALAPQYGTAVPALTAVKSAVRGFVHASAAEFADRGLRLGTVTIAGQVARGGPFDPSRIADAFWTMHNSATPTVEVVFDGRQAA
jgi:NAD(P)-dependent dehydrogenase (short-subunit alcohol dehydrogenase family)